MREETARTLDAAADLIERDGWAQRLAHSPDGGHCVLGAIAMVTGYHVPLVHLGHRPGLLPIMGTCEENERAMHEAAREFAHYISQDGVGNVPLWNDEPHRTPEEVVKTLRAAAIGGES